MSPEQWSTTRRLIALALVPLFNIANKKLGIDITDTAMLGFDLIFAVYVAASNWKEVQVKRLAPESVPALFATAAPSQAMPSAPAVVTLVTPVQP
jgi:hypothetical protein